MFNLLNAITLLLAQTEQEKEITVIGITLLIGFFFFLILDSVIKNKYTPKSPVVRYFMIFLMIISIIALAAYYIFVK